MYEEISSRLLSKEACENNNYCKQEFNEYWKCQEIDDNERCVCIMTDENDSVCGVNGKTYRNPSGPNCLGVEVAYNGYCIISPTLPDEGKECAKNSDCKKGYYCREKEVCKGEGCILTSNCVLKRGCEDGVCDYETESPETCPQDCKETLGQKTCNEVNTKIIRELRKIKSCNVNSDCVRPGNLALNVSIMALCCQTDIINKNADISNLRELVKEYKRYYCSGIVDCFCPNTKDQEIVCINNQCNFKFH
ncbi:MAG: hypothetical protein AABX29_09840 [Nanoarchaeota archaeon]